MNNYQHIHTKEIKSHRQWQNELCMSFHADRLPEYLIVPPKLEPVPYTPDLNQVKENAQQELVSIFERKAEAIAGNYPWFERDTWQQQEAEALAYQADTDADTPLLSGIAGERGITLSELARRVINNATAWRAVAPELCGQRQAFADQVMAATTVEEVDAIIAAILQPNDPAAA